MAPALATRDMYIGEDGEVDNQLAQFSHLSAGVPGSVMGFLDALETYGSMSRKQVIAPSIKLADKGFSVTYGFAQTLRSSKNTCPKTLPHSLISTNRAERSTAKAMYSNKKTSPPRSSEFRAKAAPDFTKVKLRTYLLRKCKKAMASSASKI